MRASNNIVRGSFYGADIEPGVFHVLAPGSFLASGPNLDLTPIDRRVHAFNWRTAPDVYDVEASSPDGAKPIPQGSNRDCRFAE